MYRKLVLLLMLICVAASLAIAWRPLRAQPGAGLTRPGALGLPGSGALAPGSGAPAPAPLPLVSLMSGCTGPVSCFLINSLLPWLLALALIRAATFRPGHRPPLPLAALKYLTALALAALTALLLYTETRTMAQAAYVLSTQTARGPVAAWLVSQAPHGLLRLLALCLVLAAPVFWLARGARLGLPRATFEAWVEVRRLAWPALVLLAISVAVETYVTPNTVAWLLQ